MEYHLHIGAHRTGTTAVQKLLESRTKPLSAAGITFLGPSDLRGWWMYDVIQGIVDGHAKSDGIEGAQDVLKDYVDAARQSTRLVVSDENLVGTMVQNHADASLYSDATTRLRAFGRIFPAPPDVVHFTIRDFAGYWQSVLAHLAMRGRLASFDIDRLARSTQNSWLPVLQGIRTAFPNAQLRVLRYDASVTSRLLAELVGHAFAARLPPASRTFGLALTESGGMDALPTGPEREALALGLRARRDGPDRVFSAAQALYLEAAYAADWQALRAGAVAGAILDPVSAEDPTT